MFRLGFVQIENIAFVGPVVDIFKVRLARWTLLRLLLLSILLGNQAQDHAQSEETSK